LPLTESPDGVPVLRWSVMADSAKPRCAGGGNESLRSAARTRASCSGWSPRAAVRNPLAPLRSV
jgi:hypothetical protein